MSGKGGVMSGEGGELWVVKKESYEWQRGRVMSGKGGIMSGKCYE